ncbi:MAG TPA: hypothetical protein VGC57_03905 [Cellulomonas sp.]
MSPTTLTDPWIDPTRYARRAEARALLRDLLAGADLDPAELALLDVVERHDAQRSAAEAAERVVLGLPDATPRADAGPERVAFERFAERFDQICARAAAPATSPTGAQAGALPGPARAEIGWWLGHRWSRRDDPATAEHLVADALARVSAVSAGPVRTGLLAGVLALTEVLAPSADQLDDLVGRHLGIPDPLDADQVHAALAGAVWSVRADTLVLTAVSPHPALEVALDRVADRVREVLVAVVRAAPELSGLPLRARAAVTPAPRADGTPSYVGAGARFHLAEDRIRELLMGENLYGDTTLALREAYQNAVDACRHRVARVELLERTGGSVPTGWPQPTVVLVQDADEVGEFVECTDTGAGMGLTEIAQAFCQAGVRAGDLPEHVAELREMAAVEPPVELVTNSRFGIGALSYFMLASAVTVTTTRLQRDGSLGHTYRVRITSPETYFRIEDLGPGTAPGTTVRLTLRPETRLSVVEALGDVVAVAAFGLDVRDELTGGRQVWAPGELHPDLGGVVGSGLAHVPVWWTRHPYEGTLLADGLRTADRSSRGPVVVDLAGRDAPRLSVDRTQILGHDEDRVRALVEAAVPSLVAEMVAHPRTDDGWSTPGSPVWLRALSASHPRAADEVARRRSAVGPWPCTVDGVRVDLTASGMPADHWARRARTGRVHDWLTSALVAGGLGDVVGLDTSTWPTVRPPLPADHDLRLGGAEVTLADLVDQSVEQGRAISDLVDRYHELGYAVPAGAHAIELDATDRALVAHEEIRRLSSTADPVVPLAVVRLAQALRLDLADVVARLDRLGFDVVAVRRLDLARLARVRPGTAEIEAASPHGRGGPPWRPAEEPIPGLVVLVAARRARRPAGSVRATLEHLGYRVDPGVDQVTLDDDDLVILGRQHAGPLPDPDEMVSLLELQHAAQATGRSARAVADRLVALGYQVCPVPEKPSVHPEVCLSDYQALDPAVPVSPVHVTQMARFHRLSEAVVRDELAAAGYVVADLGVIPDTVDALLAVTEAAGEDPAVVRPVGARVEAGELVGAAEHAGVCAVEAAERLVRLGYVVTCDPATLPPVDRASAVLASRDLDLNGNTSWWDAAQPVTAGRVVMGAWTTGLTVAEVVDRCRGLGFEVHDPREVLPVVRPGR